MAVESKKKFKYDKACTGVGCPIRFGCLRYHALDEKEKAAEVIRPPFTKKDGQFLECKEYRNI